MMFVSLPTTARRREGNVARKAKVRSVNEILRAAYRRYSKTKLTRQALKRCLG